MIRPALLAAAFGTGTVAGYLARSERQRRLRPSPSGAEKLAAAFASDGRSSWTWSRLRRILDVREPGDTAVSLAVVFASPDGSQVVATMGRGDEYPVLAVLTQHADEQGQAWWAYHAVDIPDDTSGLGGGA